MVPPPVVGGGCGEGVGGAGVGVAACEGAMKPPMEDVSLGSALAVKPREEGSRQAAAEAAGSAQGVRYRPS